MHELNRCSNSTVGIAHDHEYIDYHDAGMIIFPLFSIVNGRCVCSNSDCDSAGKHPSSKKWQHSQRMSDEEFDGVTGADGSSCNQFSSGFGVLLNRTLEPKKKLLVIDTDPRNGGHESYAKLIEEVPDVMRAGCVVETGRRDGGRHLYFSIPTDLKLVTTLPQFPGIDFKSSGFIVGAGSLHAAGYRYKFVVGSPSEIMPAPTALIELLQYKISTNPKKISYAPRHLQELMQALPNDESYGYEEWLRVGMALYSETDGGQNGYQLWCEWSEKSLVHDETEMYKKWCSFNIKTDIAVTVGTLIHYCDKAGINWRQITRQPIREYVDILARAKTLSANSEPAEIEKLVLESGDLQIIERRRVWSAIRAQTGLPFSVLEQSIKDANEKGGANHLMHARAIIQQLGQDNILSTHSGIWQWNCTGVWSQCDERTVRSWVQEGLSECKELTKSMIDSVTDLLKTDLFRPNHRFDIEDNESVNVLNGQLSLIDSEWVLQPHKKENYRTTQIPVKYNSNAESPRFAQFLCEIFPNEDGKQRAQALLEMMGYSLMSHSRHEKFSILVGNGANGKSVILRVLEELCGRENVAAVQPSQFGNKFQRAHLYRKLVNIVSESERDLVIDDAALKSITSGEITTVEKKFTDPFQISPFATCWIATNHMPRTRDFSDGLFRRALILIFDAVFKPELGNCDPYLVAKLNKELPGILKTVLEAYKDALLNGFTMPPSSLEAAAGWRLEADQVAQFISDDCDTGKGYEVQFGALHDFYKQWATGNSVQGVLSKKAFRDRLRRLGHGDRRDSTARYVTGVQLRHGVCRSQY